MCGVDFVLHFHFIPYFEVRGTTGIVFVLAAEVFIVGFTVQILCADDIYYVQLGEPKYVTQ